jgi:lysophospholipase L1-like esterase
MHLTVFVLLLIGAVAWAASPLPDGACRRIAFLGSSTTDGNTYPLLVRQAFADGKLPVPCCLNAGAGGDSTAAMAKRLERDVLANAPTLVVLQVGANDPATKVTPAAFATEVEGLLTRLKAAGVPAVLLSTNIRDPKHVGHEALLAAYNAELPRLAEQFGARVADAFALQQAARAAGQQVLDTDGLHPNFAGHRLIARALLDAMGYPELAVPERLAPALLPGVVTRWRMTTLASPLTEETARALRPRRDWKRLTLPLRAAHTSWWDEQERACGFALGLKALLGPAKRYVGIATVKARADAPAVLNTGAGLQAVWLNGVRVYQSDGWHGWHAGRERLPIALRRGTNTLVIETGENFFLSITDKFDW